jgi:hypothetical protein
MLITAAVAMLFSCCTGTPDNATSALPAVPKYPKYWTGDSGVGYLPSCQLHGSARVSVQLALIEYGAFGGKVQSKLPIQQLPRL